MGKSNQKKSAKQLILDGIEFHSNNGSAVARYVLVNTDGKVIQRFNEYCPDVKASYGGVRTARSEMKQHIVDNILGYAKNLVKDEQLVEYGKAQLERANANLAAAKDKLDRGEIKVPDFQEYEKAVWDAEQYLDQVQKIYANELRVKEFIETNWSDRL